MPDDAEEQGESSNGKASAETWRGCTVASRPKTRIMMAIIIRPERVDPGAKDRGLEDASGAQRDAEEQRDDEGVEDAVGEVVDATMLMSTTTPTTKSVPAVACAGPTGGSNGVSAAAEVVDLGRSRGCRRGTRP